MSKHPLHGDIYWADLEPVRGSEQKGQRPVFITSNNLMNEVSPVILVAPMTRKEKVLPPFEIPYKKEHLNLIDKNVTKLRSMGYKFDEQIEGAVILCQQSRSISKDRLIMKVGNFTVDTYAREVKDAMSFLYAINGCLNCHQPMRIDALRCRKCGTAHNKKCYSCQGVFNINYNFCPHCGKEVRKRWRT